MKRLSKDDISARNVLANKLFDAQTKVEEAIDAYNEIQSEVEEWRDEIVSRMQEYYDERSERWQDGEKGEEYSAWIDSYNNLYLGEIEHPDFNLLPDLEQLPETAAD